MPKRKHRRNNNNNKPLVPPPNKTMSRKRARVVTTQFHKLERQRAAAAPQELAAVQAALQAMGGRPAYQKASQVSTAFHSTSKWVLGYLLRNGWYYGILRVEEQEQQEEKVHDETMKNGNNDNDVKNRKRKGKQRRPTRILEIGAINTELLDAAAKPKQSDDSNNKNRLNLDVRAIDLHCMDRRIEKADFLQIPVSHADENQRYDVIVCSMVLNCVPTALARGEMVCRLYHFLRPGGLLFFTIPRTCLAFSPFMDRSLFANLLATVGFEIIETKESPKIAFFVCQRIIGRDDNALWDPKWTHQRIIKQGKKFTNEFAVVLSQESYQGQTLTFPEK